MVKGRPTKYNDEVLVKSKEYLNGGYKTAGHVVPSTVGLAVYLGVVSSTVKLWGKEHKAFSATLREIDDLQHIVALGGGMDGTFNSAITKLLLHNHGYSDRSQTEHSGSISLGQVLEDIDGSSADLPED